MYLWLKAFHVIAVMAWMAGMLYLPRLFVYHCAAEAGSTQSETFKVMERRLLNAIITPAMVVSWVLGLWLAWAGGAYAAGWLHAKVVLVLVLCTVFLCAACVNSRSTRTGIRRNSTELSMKYQRFSWSES
jgi:putative membrane protein